MLSADDPSQNTEGTLLAFANADDRFAVVTARHGNAHAINLPVGRYRLLSRAPAGHRYACGEDRDCAALEIVEGGRMRWWITIEAQHDRIGSER
jgi:hypothetical protein